MQAVPGRIMGHSGAFVGHEEGGAHDKAGSLADAGAVLTDHPSKFGTVMRELLENGSSRAVGFVKLAISATNYAEFRSD